MTFDVFPNASYSKTKKNKNIQIFAVFDQKWRNMLSLNAIFSEKVGRIKKNRGTRQIDAWEVTESFVSISDAVSELSRKSGTGRGGGQNLLPRRGS